MQNKTIKYAAIAFLFFAVGMFAQDSDQSSILINTSSVTQVPADAIYFMITLSTKNKDPKKTFDDHKTLEKNLLKVFKEFEIADSNISYSLLHIAKFPVSQKNKTAYQTRQTVSVKLYDFDKYEPFQLALLSNGIYTYNAKFTTEGQEEWVEKGIQEAVSKATKEAELTARNLGKRLGEIINVESNHYYPSTSEGITALTIQQPGESLIDLPRFVQMRVSLRIRFQLLEK